ncbi:RND superfamily putative drug exporter [Cellulomonas soli]|uniref:MMPL family transporter n=1 Tax=Cellulomonas soli TaxID=931535 RepID=UPI0017C46CD1|nr:MMPL family transporter [Cellulomonas soli]NYI59598.1 RND superfamily putative drug exporter [Cellulomonas soli]
MVIAWLAVFAGLAGVIGVNGMGESAPDTIPGSRSTQALELMAQEFPSAQTATDAQTLQLVFAPDGGTVSDPAVAEQIQAVLAQAAALPGLESVSNPLDPASPYISADQSVAVSTLTFVGLDEDGQQASYDAALALQEQAPTDLGVQLGGNLVAIGAPEQGAGEMIGVLAAFLVLILTFGSLRAAGANLLVAAFGVGVGILGVFAYGSITPIGENSIILASMLGLAVGIDYGLFIVSRFQQEVRSGKTITDAIARATGTAGTAVVFAGATVIVALVALMVANIGFITEMGVAAAFGVLVAVLLSLTLLPVFLQTMGLKALSTKHRRDLAAGRLWTEDVAGKRGFLRSWGTLVVKRPLLSLLAGAAILITVALPVLSMKTAFTIPGGADPESTERTAYNLIVDKFGGVQSPLIVLAEGADVTGSTDQLEEALAALPGVAMVTPAEIGASGDIARVTIIPTGGPIEESTTDLVHTIRANEDTMVPGVSLEVTGETAIGIDQTAALNTALIKYVIVIVLISMALLVLMFRSILIPVIATAGYLLSVLASFGASTAVFQWGWNFPLVRAAQGDPMMSLLPILLVGVLFGLAMDYQVFLVSRIKEMHDRGMAPKDAIVEGFSRAAPVLAAAATIMTVVFAGFASSTFAIAAGIAFGLFIGVMADAFIVRLILMPAAMSLLGRSAWWIPRWLDKVLPRIDTEGHALQESTPEREPELVNA